MRVKTFRGTTTQQVMQKVKIELGNEAVILNTKNFTENGHKVCEVLAAVDSGSRSFDDHQKAVVAPQGVEWHKELSRLKESIFAVLNTHMDKEQLTPRQRQAVTYLEDEGVNHEVLLEIWRSLRNAQEGSVLKELTGLVRLRPWNCRQWSERVHILVGPNGVGKTSTLLRMALQYRQENPREKVCLVNGDTHQGKGRLLLKHYAELSDFAYREISRSEDWMGLLSEARTFSRIFIDAPGHDWEGTVGRMIQDQGRKGHLNGAVHLVLSPLYADEQFTHYVHLYSSSSPKSLIWTKLDEACRFGALVNVGYSSGLPASLLSFGPRLKDSMVAAEDSFFWRLVFKRELPTASAAAGRTESRRSKVEG